MKLDNLKEIFLAFLTAGGIGGGIGLLGHYLNNKKMTLDSEGQLRNDLSDTLSVYRNDAENYRAKAEEHWKKYEQVSIELIKERQEKQELIQQIKELRQEVDMLTKKVSSLEK